MEINLTDDEVLCELNGDFRRQILPVSIFIGVEIIIGILGNAFVLYVFGVRYKASTYRVFVLYLGLIDILSCLTTMPAEILSEMFWFRYTFKSICKIKSFFNVFTVNADVLCLFTIAFDRYKRLCVPTASQIVPTSAIYLCLGISLTAAGVAVPAGIVGGLNHFNYTYNGTIVPAQICGVADGKMEHDMDRAYVHVLQGVIGLSLLPMLIFYGAIANNACFKHPDVESEDELRQKLLTNDDKDNADTVDRQQTVMLFVVSLVFIITIVTYVILDAFIADNLRHYSLEKIRTFLIFFRLYFINHVVNPFIYGWLDPKFRRIFLSFFKCN